MGARHTILHFLMMRPASGFELRRRLGPLRVLDLVTIDLCSELEQLEKQRYVRTNAVDASGRTIYEITELGADELERWFDHAAATRAVADGDPIALTRWLTSGGPEAAGLARASLHELDEEIAGWRSSIDRHWSQARLRWIADQAHLRELEHRREYLCDAMGLEAAAPRVLVADDSVAWRARAASALRAHGCEVRLAQNGTEAWQLLQRAYFDAVVLSPDSESMNGFEILHRILASPVISDLPIVMSGVADDAEAHEAARAAGASAYLWKCSPDSGRELAECVDRLLDGYARRSG
jgi:CheY-like chemotaxis protein/DNA-binding PadR family transcriptional regulator